MVLYKQIMLLKLILTKKIQIRSLHSVLHVMLIVVLSRESRSESCLKFASFFRPFSVSVSSVCEASCNLNCWEPVVAQSKPRIMNT